MTSQLLPDTHNLDQLIREALLRAIVYSTDMSVHHFPAWYTLEWRGGKCIAQCHKVARFRYDLPTLDGRHQDYQLNYLLDSDHGDPQSQST